jgi:hypothetical protein
MSVESKRLRDRAAAQLRQGRRTKNAGLKAVHNQRAAAWKEMAHTEEWRRREPERSARRQPKRTKAPTKQ